MTKLLHKFVRCWLLTLAPVAIHRHSFDVVSEPLSDERPQCHVPCSGMRHHHGLFLEKLFQRISLVCIFFSWLNGGESLRKNETAYVTTSASTDTERCISRNLSSTVESGVQSSVYAFALSELQPRCQFRTNAFTKQRSGMLFTNWTWQTV